VKLSRRRPNRWVLLTLCTLAVVVRSPWLGVLASLLGDLIETMSRGRSFSRVLELGLRTDQRWAVSRPQLSRMDYQIGSSDLRMPENIDGRAGSCFRRDLRRPIGLGRMQSAAIAVAFDRLFVVGTPMIRLMVGIVTSSKVPVLALGGTVNVFNPLAGAALAPGSIVEIYGANLASTTAQAASTPLPDGARRDLGDNRRHCLTTLLRESRSDQCSGSVGVASWKPISDFNRRTGAVSTSDTIQVTAVSPGVAALLSGSAIATHADGALITTALPARPGETVVLYSSGLGAKDPAIATGAASPASPLARARSTPVVTVNGANAVVSFAGMTPYSVGLPQINFQIPLGSRDGDLLVAVSQDGARANAVTFSVHQ
jgi:hypothetical protein